MKEVFANPIAPALPDGDAAAPTVGIIGAGAFGHALAAAARRRNARVLVWTRRPTVASKLPLPGCRPADV